MLAALIDVVLREPSWRVLRDEERVTALLKLTAGMVTAIPTFHANLRRLHTAGESGTSRARALLLAWGGRDGGYRHSGTTGTPTADSSYAMRIWADEAPHIVGVEQEDTLGPLRFDTS
ncbi:Uncharacterised protein [Mycobacteroides abscessus subsp. massiliense]|nr:Uncharacterised protein [Mycobacteroides abscessus subsp. massiliense]SKU11342.1 Uncharacterised protein [Mycobacteroides abscessus subsp. massiliense]